MSSNLENFCTTLLRVYGENYAVVHGPPPTYLAKIIGAEEAAANILLFYNEDRNKVSSTKFISPSKLNLNKDEANNLDLTGSPLKDECVLDGIADDTLDLKITSHPWKSQEEYHKGIGVDKARAIICKEEFQLGNDAVGSVWFLCNAADEENTLFLQYEFASGYFCRGILHFTGVVPAHTLNSQSLLRQHLTLMRPGDVGVETKIENTYQIKSHIKVCCSWSTTATLPSLVDLTTCDVILKQTFRLSACNPLTEDYLNQLRILTLIRNDIITYRKKSGDVVYRWGCGIDMEELRDSIGKAMTEITGFGEIDITEHGLECDIEAVIQRAKMRRLTDLTDTLWEILKRCSSYEDLKIGFNILFQSAVRCNIVNTPTNKNRLAEIITEVANRRLAIPCLTGTEPLELLLEIGLEKLYKDYELIFTESKICSSNVLKNKSLIDTRNDDSIMPNVRKSLHNAVRPDAATMRKTLLHNIGKNVPNEDILGFKNSNFDERETAAHLAKLLQVHCTLEHLLMIHVNLNINSVYSDVCEQLLNKMPQFFGSIDDSLKDEIEIPLSAHNVREHLEGKEPHTRRITIKSKNKLREVKSTFYYCMDNICPPNVLESFQTEEKEMTKEATYFSWLYRKMRTLH